MKYLTQADVDEFSAQYNGHDKMCYLAHLEMIEKRIEKRLAERPSLGYMPYSAAEALRRGKFVHTVVHPSAQYSTDVGVKEL